MAVCVSASMPVVRKRSRLWPVPVDHAQSGVLRARELRSRLDELLEERVERELRAQRDAGVDEDAQTVEWGLLGQVPPGVCRRSLDPQTSRTLLLRIREPVDMFDPSPCLRSLQSSP